MEVIFIPVHSPSTNLVIPTCLFQCGFVCLFSKGEDLSLPPILNVKMECDESSDPFGHELGIYPVASNPRGYCIIINNMEFDGSNPRQESSNDAKELLSLFKCKLGFHVEIYNNLTSEEMLVLLRNARGADHSSLSCFVLAILSHGGEHGKIYGTDDKPVLVRDIASYFTGDQCQTLKDKPKIFIFGACRGPYDDPGVAVEETDSGRRTCEEERKAVDGGYTIPVEADMIFIYPTPPGYQSYRWGSGSWFIQTFVRTMRKHAHKIDMLGILTETNRIVAEEYKSRRGGEKKMMPTISYTFRYRLYLPPIS